MCALVEAHASSGRVNNVFNRMFRSWDWFSNSDYCLKGCRIVLGWNPAVFDVLEIISIDQVMHCVVIDLESKNSFHCSIVYAANEYVARRALWKSLCSYNMLTVTSPWIVVGDFNTNLNISEMQGGVDSRTPATQEFKELSSWGGVVKYLDRVMANLNFLNKFVGTSVNFLPRGVSDHSPDVVDLQLCGRRGIWKQRVGGVKMYQNQMDLYPFDEDIRSRENAIVREYRTCKLEDERHFKQRAKEVNATLIALIPKIDHPTMVGEFRPVALFNVLYKCITKIIANRIKGCLNGMVDDTQNAFIPGRLISDDIFLTQELLENYHRQVGFPRCAIKVDIRKAYDSVSWDFLSDALQLFGFPEKMIG
ncbi:hypothetical protein AgCh_025780 [Apium graveolens]